MKEKPRSFIRGMVHKQIIRFRYIKTIQGNKAEIVFMNEDDKIIINCDNDIEVMDRRLNI